MKKYPLYLAFMLLLALSAGLCLAAGEPSTEHCLECHDWEEISDREPYYTGYNPEESMLINPHRYVPHETSDKVSCVSCHTPHDEEEPDASQVVKASVTECFMCHHSMTFKLCGECHFE